jgi:hypothetical protein
MSEEINKNLWMEKSGVIKTIREDIKRLERICELMYEGELIKAYADVKDLVELDEAYIKQLEWEIKGCPWGPEMDGDDD